MHLSSLGPLLMLSISTHDLNQATSGLYRWIFGIAGGVCTLFAILYRFYLQMRGIKREFAPENPWLKDGSTIRSTVDNISTQVRSHVDEFSSFKTAINDRFRAVEANLVANREDSTSLRREFIESRKELRGFQISVTTLINKINKAMLHSDGSEGVPGDIGRQ